jgi:predicted dehydrogenase
VWPEARAVGRPLVVGLLGATGIARRAMVEPARRVDGVAVRAVAATDPERAAAFARDHGVPVAHPSYEALLADPAVDVAYLSMHSGAHGRWAVAAAEAGKHVVVEKPLCLSRDELAAIRVAAEASRVVVVEAVMTAGHPWLAAARELVAAHGRGGPVEMRSRLAFEAPDRTGYRYDPGLGGGAWFDAASYWLQAMQATVGLEGAVARGSSDFAGPNGVDDRFVARLDWPDGSCATLDCSLGHGSAAEHEFVMAGGTLRVRNVLLPAVGRFPINLAVTVGGARRRVESFPPRHYYDDQLARIVALIAAGVDHSAASAALDEAAPRVALIEDAYRSARAPSANSPPKLVS